MRMAHVVCSTNAFSVFLREIPLSLHGLPTAWTPVFTGVAAKNGTPFQYSIIIIFLRYIGGLNFLSLKAFETTVTEEKAMAPAAKIGLRRMPKKGKRMPAATGIKIVL